jgi:hypothetical protein
MRHALDMPPLHVPTCLRTAQPGLVPLALLMLNFLNVVHPISAIASERAPTPDLKRLVEEDWNRQELRLGRASHTRETLTATLTRTAKLLEWGRHRLDASTAQSADADLAALRREAEDLPSDGDPGASVLCYQKARWLCRDLALRLSGIEASPIVFLQRNRYICQMLHEYMGYFYDYGKVPPGGALQVLQYPGFSLATRDLLPGQLTNGNFTTMTLAPDARTIYFAFAERARIKPDFYSAERRSFHLYQVDADGSNLRQLTHGVEDDFDPCPLPDGGIAFMSTRRGGFARCNNAWEPCATYTLHRMNADGSNIRTLSFHETSEWHPSVLNDGRVAYIRWDYVDRSAANFHGIWTSNPDGSGAASLFGNYTMRINACYQPRAIPGSEKLLFIAGAHHADVGGSLVLLDPRRAALDPQSGEDKLDSIEVLTPEVCFPESQGWPKSYFHSPWPLSEDQYLVSFSFDPLPGMSSGMSQDTRTGLYYFDRFGNLELLYRAPEISCMYPIPLTPRPAPPVRISSLDPALGNEGEFLLSDVRKSLFPMPSNRKIRELRVFQLLPKPPPHAANEPRIGHANAENARMLLGTAPVEEDGSAYFRAPAGKPLYFQAVDESGRAVQSMRSATYLQPGERRGCIGCHESPGTVANSQPNLAMRRGPSHLEPGPEGSRPFSFPLLVQPVLDRHCVHCHDGQSGDGKSALVLTSELQGTFTRSYLSLKPHLRWYEWGEASISQIATHPGRIGASESPLTRVLEDQHHAGKIQWTESDLRRFYLWLDANVPFYGTYQKEDQLSQRLGKSVAPPVFQ